NPKYSRLTNRDLFSRDNVLRNLSDKAFNKPICEALLNQKFFNGVGNYLRAEILHRSKIPPFEKARTVLEELQRGLQGGNLRKRRYNQSLNQPCRVQRLPSQGGTQPAVLLRKKLREEGNLSRRMELHKKRRRVWSREPEHPRPDLRNHLLICKSLRC
ncbi:Endonuclease 8-like 1, partial [Ophiophagus hannah]